MSQFTYSVKTHSVWVANCHMQEIYMKRPQTSNVDIE